MDASDIAQLAGAGATFGLVLLTGLYVWTTRVMVVEMRAAREEQRWPYIVLDIDHPMHGFCNLVMRNTGNAPAFDVKVTFAPDLPYQDSGRTLSSLPIFEHAQFFPDGKEVSFFLRSLIGEIPPEEERLLNASVRYRNASGKWFEESFTLDPYLRRDLLLTSQKGVHEIAERLERIDRSLDRASRSLENLESATRTLAHRATYPNTTLAGPTAKSAINAKLQEFLIIWEVLYGKDISKNSHLLQEELRTYLLQLVQVITSCEQLSAEELRPLLEIIADVGQLSDLRFYIDGGASLERFQTIGDQVCQSIRGLKITRNDGIGV